MKYLILMLFTIVCVTGCQTSRSISDYKSGYNFSYRGEVSQMDFIKEISRTKATGSSEPILIEKGERVMLMQSGQLQPDLSMIKSFGSTCSLIPISGIPDREKNAIEGVTLVDAAKAGGVTKIVAYWGNIETSIKPTDGKAVSWIPIAGYYVPDESQKMRVSISAIVSDVTSGRWFNFTAYSKETEISHSNYSARQKDAEQVEQLKKNAYKKLILQLTE